MVSSGTDGRVRGGEVDRQGSSAGTDTFESYSDMMSGENDIFDSQSRSFLMNFSLLSFFALYFLHNIFAALVSGQFLDIVTLAPKLFKCDAIFFATSLGFTDILKSELIRTSNKLYESMLE